MNEMSAFETIDDESLRDEALDRMGEDRIPITLGTIKTVITRLKRDD